LNIRYRQMIEPDVAAIARVHRRACLITYQFMNWSYRKDEVRRWYAGKFWEWDWGLVAEEDRVVGFVTTMGAHLDQLFVDPAYQGRGIGTSLLTTTLERTPAVATLFVFEENVPARRFYERYGFREASWYLNEEVAAVELVYDRRANSAP
jgi:ribosomal protein S18 acetylase RimI-like enzyme